MNRIKTQLYPPGMCCWAADLGEHASLEFLNFWILNRVWTPFPFLSPLCPCPPGPRLWLLQPKRAAGSFIFTVWLWHRIWMQAIFLST